MLLNIISAFLPAFQLYSGEFPDNNPTAVAKSGVSVLSRVMSFSMGTLTPNKHRHHTVGGRRFQDRQQYLSDNKIPLIRAIPSRESNLHVPITIHFEHQHINRSNSEKGGDGDDGAKKRYPPPTCVYWDGVNHTWSGMGCRLAETNRTHSVCACHRLATYALLVDVSGREGVEIGDDVGWTSLGFGPLVAIVVLSTCLAVVFVMAITIFVSYSRKIKVRRY